MPLLRFTIFKEITYVKCEGNTIHHYDKAINRPILEVTKRGIFIW